MDETKLDPTLVAALYVQHAAELKHFLLGVLRNAEAADDVLQITFAKCVEWGHKAREETQKGWLFRVAFHEALALKRRQNIHSKATQKLSQTSPTTPAIDEGLLRWESVQSVRAALEELPEDQRQVVWQRIYEEKTFAAIAEELQLPLGTVLTRMRLALEKLRKRLSRPADQA